MTKEIVLPQELLRYDIENVSGGEFWSPIAGPEIFRKIKDNAELAKSKFFPFFLSPLTGLMASASIAVVALGGFRVDPELSWLSAVIGLGGSTVTSAVIAVRNRKYVKFQPMVLAANSKAFSMWVKRRYGLTVAENVLVGNGSYPFEWRWNEDNKIKFMDSHGRRFLLKATIDQKFYVIEDSEEIKPTPKQEELVMVSTRLSVFTGEAAALHESIANHISKLQKLDLDVEKNHVLARVREDLNHTTQVYTRLVELDEKETDSVELRNVLSALNLELFNLLREEVAGLKNELVVQRDYIQTRAVLPASSVLSLTASVEGNQPVSSVNAEKSEV